MTYTSHTSEFLCDVTETAASMLLEVSDQIEKLVAALVALRESNGRLFIIGIGGGAGNASHAVNDFRKLCGIEAYAPTDNVSELTARTNDEGFETVFVEWLKVSRLNSRDMILIFSVGGGSSARNVSLGIVRAVEYAIEVGATVAGIVGRSDGAVAQMGHYPIVVPVLAGKWITPLTESFQVLIWHCIVSHPDLQVKATTW